MKYIAVIVRELFWITAALLIIAGGFLGFKYLESNREIVTAEQEARPATPVETTDLRLFEEPLPIRGEGFIEPFRTVSLSAPTGGRVVMLHPAITNRGTFRQGEVLVEIDASAERAQILQARASIAATEARLDLTETQLRRSLDLLDKNVVSQSSADDLLGQQEELRANLEGQRAQLASAEIALQNKTVTAPFSGRVQAKEAEIGDVVGAGSTIAYIYTDHRMELSIAISESDAALIPGLFDGSPARAMVTIEFAGVEQAWLAEVVRVDPSLDRETRTLEVTVALRERVLGENVLPSGTPPVLINAFANVVIDGIEPENTYAIPSTALRNGDTVWLFRSGALVVHPATLVHVDGENSFVGIKHLEPDDRLILSVITAPQPGKDLRDITAESRISFFQP